MSHAETAETPERRAELALVAAAGAPPSEAVSPAEEPHAGASKAESKPSADAVSGAPRHESLERSVAPHVRGLEADLLRGAFYHGARMRFLDRVHRWTMFLVVIMGAGSIAATGLPEELLALGATIIGAANVAFAFVSRARDHDALRRQYYELIARLVRGRGDPQAALQVECEMLRLKGQEPPRMRALDLISANVAAQALGMEVQGQVLHPLAWRHRVLAQVYPFTGEDWAEVARKEEQRLRDPA
jgi:hypothetical protein